MTTHEVEIGRSQSPFEKLGTYFNSFAKITDADKIYGELRGKILKDGTSILIRQNLNGFPAGFEKSFIVAVKNIQHTNPEYQADDVLLSSQGLSFRVGENGLQLIRIPEPAVALGKVLLSTKLMQATNLMRASDEDKLAVAEELVTWLGGIMERDEWADPPISVSIFK